MFKSKRCFNYIYICIFLIFFFTLLMKTVSSTDNYFFILSATKSFTPVYRLLSSSLDKTVIIWEPIPRKEGSDAQDSGAWVESVRVGEVGGNGLGFYGSRFGPSGKSFLGHGYNGSFHMWKHDEVCSLIF